MNLVRKLLRCGALLWASASSLFTHAAALPPTGLDDAEWSGLRAAYDAGRHRIAATAGGHQARNPGQRWRTRFDGQGFLVQPDGADWQWGLELTAYGFPGREHTVPTGSANTLADLAETRLDYAWDAGLSEWFVNDARGLEHGFTVHERPDDRQVLDCGDMSPLSLHHDWLTDAGQLHDLKEKRRPAGAVQAVDATATQPAIHYPPSPLNFHLAVRGGLRPVLEPDGRGVRFVDAHGTTRTTYAGLKVWDADGQMLSAHFELSDAGHPGEITLAVDERAARYPLTIDPIAQQAYLKASNTGVGDQFGTAVGISGDTLVVGAPYESSKAVGVNGDQADDSAVNSGAVYVFVRREGVWVQQAYLKASNNGAGDGFGSSVAIAGDTIVIGAPNEDGDAKGVNGDQLNNRSSDSGAAYIFVRNGTTWTQQAYLKAGNTGALDAFGTSVAVSGDTVVVGAPIEDSKPVMTDGVGADDSVPDSGAVYIFVRTGTTWRQQAYIKASNAGSIDLFGASVSISADTVVVGAYGESSNATGVNGNQLNNQAGDSGAAYVFVRNGTAWTQQAYLKASNTGKNDFFGASVSISGASVAVGAAGESNGSGAVYVFMRLGAAWAQQAYLKAVNRDSGIRFGHAVAIVGDMLAVGSPYEFSGPPSVNGVQEGASFHSSGAAYVFVRRGAAWTQQAFLKTSNPGAGDFVGNAVAISAATVVVGAVHEASRTMGVNGNGTDDGAFNSGAAYVFGRKTLGIKLEQPAGVGLTDGVSNVRFGTVAEGGSTDLDFTIRNSGTTNLTDFGVNLNGPNANQFLVTANPGTSLAPGERTTFTVRFSPTSEGTKTATLHLASNDPDHNPFDVTLVGTPNVPTVATGGNDLTVSFVGTPGSRYRVQYLPGLTGPWTEFTPPALYTAPASGVFSHTDVNPPDTLRLYRAVLAP